MRVEVRPELLDWARDRAGLSIEAVVKRLPKFAQWEREEARPTLRQLEQFAKLTHTPVGYLFLPERPVEVLPIPDFRTVSDGGVGRPSPDLLDTVYTCQQRQEWFRDYARSEGQEAVAMVGQATTDSSIEATAAQMRATLGFDLAERRKIPTWTDALGRFIEQAEGQGVLVMVNGVVGNNNRRKLNPNEFRGFALVDELAPLIFINGADTKNGQMFTVAHELAHIWLGQSALSDATAATIPAHRVERWCHQVATKVLEPLSPPAEPDRNAELAPMRINASPVAGVSRRFARAVVNRTIEGHTLYRDAFRLLGVSRAEALTELGKNLD